MNKYGWGAVLAAIVLLLITSIWPVQQERIITRGTDNFASHYPLFGERTYKQDVVLQGKLSGAGAIVVNLRHAASLAPVKVAVLDKNSREVQTGIIPEAAIQDDTFAKTHWSTPVARSGDRITLVFTAPEAKNTNAIGMRFEADTKTLAVSVDEKVPLAQSILTAIQNSRNYRVILLSIAASLLLVLIVIIPLRLSLSLPQRQWYIVACLSLLVISAIVCRLLVLQHFKGVSGGDPYNYLFITKSLSEGINPFEGVKRLPGYPLLLLPAFLTSLDDVWFMQFVSIVSAGGVLVALFFLARTLKLPWPIQILAPTLLAFQKDFFWTSLRPEPYTLYAFLLLLSLVLFFHLRRHWAQLLFGVVLGYAAMTRQEGFVLAAVLGTAALTQWKSLWWKGYARIFLPALLIVTPFFIHNARAYGNPLFTPYFEGDRLQIVNSWESFQDSAGAAWGVLSALWRPIWDQQFRVELNDPWFAVGIFTLLAWWLTQKYGSLLATSKRRQQALTWTLVVGSIAVLLAAASLALHNRTFFEHIVINITAGFLVASVIPFLDRTRWQGIVVVAVAVTQLLVATWFHPFPKHYQQTYPLLLLMIVAALSLRDSRPPAKSPNYLGLTRVVLQTAVWVMPLTIGVGILILKLPLEIDRYNSRTALDYVTYQAVKTARALPGPHGFNQAYLPARLYFDSHGHYFLEDKDASPAAPQQWLANTGVHTLVVTNDHPAFTAPEPTWKQVDYHKSEGRNEKLFESWVYEIP